MWNVFANPDFPGPQAGFRQILPQLLGLPTPQIENARVAGNQIVFSGTSGLPGGTCYVLASADLQSESAGWAVLATNRFDSHGRFDIALPAEIAAPQRFYRLSLAIPDPTAVLPLTIARFKTPTLRDLGHSDPYMHTGRLDSIEDVIRFYQKFSRLARHDNLRNGDPELKHIFLNDSDVAPLAAFLRSLNEDYTD
jgi:hypothetical protein